MSFWQRLFNSDLRAAETAEARGQVDRAAEGYARAGDRAGAVRMHVARARRAVDRAGELAALHEALHWAGDDGELRREPAAGIGRVMLAQAEAEGIGTERDRGRVRVAAELLIEGHEFQLAGDALMRLGDLASAAAAYSAGGLIDALEVALAAADEGQLRARVVGHGYAAYQTLMQVGRRDDARAELVACVHAGGDVADYRRQLDQLDAARLLAGRVLLRPRGAAPIIVCATPLVAIGRDVLCDVPMRTTGVSRRHAEVVVLDVAPWFLVRDAGSRNGTRIGGLAIAGPLPLQQRGDFALGDDAVIDFTVVDDPAGRGGPHLTLTVRTGLDRGTVVIVGRPGMRLPVPTLAPDLDVMVVDGRPWLGRAPGSFTLGTQQVAEGRVQLIRGDHLRIDTLDLEVD